MVHPSKNEDGPQTHPGATTNQLYGPQRAGAHAVALALKQQLRGHAPQLLHLTGTRLFQLGRRHLAPNVPVHTIGARHVLHLHRRHGYGAQHLANDGAAIHTGGVVAGKQIEGP
jgi:hypothetical protein